MSKGRLKEASDPNGISSLDVIAGITPNSGFTGSNVLPGQKLGKYDQGVTMYHTPNDIAQLRYQNQTNTQALGNALVQSLGEVGLGTLEGFGYLLDFEQHGKALVGAEKEFDNFLSKAMRENKEALNEQFPVYTNPDQPFQPLSARYWEAQLPSVLSTLTLMVPTGAAVGFLSKIPKLGKFLTEGKLLGGALNMRSATSGAISRVLESTMEAAGNADSHYKSLIAEGYTEESARKEAGKVAANTYYANLPLMLADMFEYDILFKGRNVQSAIDALGQVGKKKSLIQKITESGLYKSAKVAASEGFEEGYQYGVGKEAAKNSNALNTIGAVVQNFPEYFSDPEFLSSVVVGAASGGGMSLIGSAIEKMSSKLGETGVDNLPDANVNSALDVIKNAGKSAKDAVVEQTTGLTGVLKDKFEQAANKLKSLFKYNTNVQEAESKGDFAKVHEMQLTKFHELINNNLHQSFLDQAKEAGEDTSAYEQLLAKNQELTLQYQGNSLPINVATQAYIKRQAATKLTPEITKRLANITGATEEGLRQEYLKTLKDPDAKQLKIDGDFEVPKVPKATKDLVKQKVDLEIEAIKLDKAADKLNTPEGEEQFNAEAKQAIVSDISKSTDYQELSEAAKLEDKELAQAAFDRLNKLAKEAMETLPPAANYDTFEDYLNDIQDPILANLVQDSIDVVRQVLDKYNKERGEYTDVLEDYTNEDEDNFIKDLADDLKSSSTSQGTTSTDNQTDVAPLDATASQDLQSLPREVQELGDNVNDTSKVFEKIARKEPTLWKKIKELIENIGKKLGIVSNEQHLSNFKKAKAEWSKLSSRDKKLKRADYELDDLHHTEGGYYKVGNSLIDLDLNPNHFKLLLENKKFLNVLNKLGVTKIHGENRPVEEMFGHYSDNKIHLNNNSAFENIRQVTNAMSHELGHHEWTKLTKEERDYVRTLPLETGMAKHYEAQEKSGKGKETGASLQEENFADYVMQYFQGKLYGDNTLLDTIPEKLKKIFDNKYSSLLESNEYLESAEIYHETKAYNNSEFVKEIEQLLTNQNLVNTPSSQFEIGDTIEWNILSDQVPESEEPIDENPLEVAYTVEDFEQTNETIAAIELYKDYMLQNQIYFMQKPDKYAPWSSRRIIKKNGYPEVNPPEFLEWTPDVQATEEFFNTIGDPSQYDVFFEVNVTKKSYIVTPDNVPIQLFVERDGKKIYIGQLQTTSKVKDKTDKGSLQLLRQKAFDFWVQGSGSKILGKTKIKYYHKGFYNTVPTHRPVVEALTQEEKDNFKIGIYTGHNEAYGSDFITNDSSILTREGVRTISGSVHIGKKSPTGGWVWINVTTQKLGDMPDLVDQLKSEFDLFVKASKEVAALPEEDKLKAVELAKKDDPRLTSLASLLLDEKAILARVRKIVRYKVKGKLEPDFNHKLILIKKFQTDGVFDVDKFIASRDLLNKKVQIDFKKIEDSDYVASIMNRLTTDIAVQPFINPFMTVPAGEDYIDEPVLQQEIKEEIPTEKIVLNIAARKRDTPKFMKVDKSRESAKKLSPNRAIAYLKRVLPNKYTVEILDGLIKVGNVEAYGMVHNSAVTLSKLAPEGVDYHEAWHIIEAILPAFQRKYISKIGTEEERADRFMEYKATHQESNSFLRRVFENILAFINDLVGYQATLEDIFQRIDNGYYKNFKPVTLPRMFSVSGLTRKQQQYLVNVYLNKVNSLLDLSDRKNVSKLINNDIKQNELLVFGVPTTDEGFGSPLYEFVLDILVNNPDNGVQLANQVLKYIRPDLQVGVSDEGNVEVSYTDKPTKGVLYASLLKDLGKRGYKIILERDTASLNPDVETDINEDDTIDIEEESTKEGWQEKASLRSPMEKLSKRIKQLIYSIETDVPDSLGLGFNLTYNGYETYSRLASVITDSIDVEDMKAKMESRIDPFFKSFMAYIKTKYANTEAVYTELFKALGDKNHPEYWMVNAAGLSGVEATEENKNSVKQRIKNLVNNVPYKGDLVNYLSQIGIEGLDLSDKLLVENLVKDIQNKKGDQVFKALENQISNTFLDSHLSVEGKKIYEIINGSYFGKLMTRLNRDFENTKKTLFSKDAVLSKLPIFRSKPGKRDFKFVMYGGYKDKSGNGFTYDHFTEPMFMETMYHMWEQQNVYPTPILSDSPNIIGTRYVIPEDVRGNMYKAIAELIHIEHARTLSKFGNDVKNYGKNKLEILWFKNIPYKADLNEQALAFKQYFEKEILPKEEAYIKGIGISLPKLAQYTLEHMYVHTQLSWITVGDPAFYKGLIDYYKRAKQIWSPVIRGNVKNNFKGITVHSPIQKGLVLDDVEELSEQDEELKSIGFDYGKVSKTDAQTFIDLYAYRDRMITLNEWTDDMQATFEVLEKGETPYSYVGNQILGNNKAATLTVIKPFYFNWNTVEDGFIAPTQKKDSESLIVPFYGRETINGKPNPMYNPQYKEWLEQMGYDFTTMSYNLDNRKYDFVTYDTTVKVGKRPNMTFDLAQWGKQQETPAHHLDSDVIFGTQIMKLITANLDKNEIYYQGLDAVGTFKLYNQLLTEGVVEASDKLLSEVTVENVKRLLIEDMVNRGMREDYIDSVSNLPLSHPIHVTRVEQILNSLSKNKITKIKMEHGYTFANASSIGFARQPKIVWNGGDPKKGISHFEVYAPINDKRLYNYIDSETGLVDMVKLANSPDAKLTEGLVYRIPTEGKYSMFNIKVIGYLPVDNGVIYMPDMVTKIAGLDFDIDKVRGFFFGGSEREDKILDIMSSILKHPSSLQEQLTPGGFDRLKETNRLIRAAKKGLDIEKFLALSEKEQEAILEDTYPYYSPSTLSIIAKRMNTGKALVGSAANFNAVQALIQYSKVYVKPITFNGEQLSEVSKTHATDGTLISSNIAQILAAVVDNGKDPQAEYSNFTLETINSALTLLYLGVPLDVAQMFMTQVDTSLDLQPQALDITSEGVRSGLIKGGNTTVYTAMYKGLGVATKKLGDLIKGVKVANAGAGPSLIDNLLKIKTVRKALGNSILEQSFSDTLTPDATVTEALINKGLVNWNKHLVNELGMPNMERGVFYQIFNEAIDNVFTYVSDEQMKSMYNSVYTYIASGFDFFKYDNTVVNNVQTQLQKYKELYPDNKFLGRLELKNGVVNFIGGNTNDEVEIQTIIDSWNDLLNEVEHTNPVTGISIDTKQAKDTIAYAEKLIKYAFYKKGFEFGFNTFGQLIPVDFFIKNKEFTEHMEKGLKAFQQNNSETALNFIEQYIRNNHRDVNLPKVTSEIEYNADGTVFTMKNVSYDSDTVSPRYVKAGKDFEHVYVMADFGVYEYLKPKAVYNQKIRNFQIYSPTEKRHEVKAVETIPVLEKTEPTTNTIITQDMLNIINSNVKNAGFDKQYTLEEINALPESQKQNAVNKFGKTLKTKDNFNNSLFRGQEHSPTIDLEGNLILTPSYDTLFRSEGVSFANNMGLAESYGSRYSKNPYIIEIDKDYADKIFPLDLKGKSNDYGKRVVGDENEERIITKDKIVIPKGSYIIHKKSLDYNFDKASTLHLVDEWAKQFFETDIAEFNRYGEAAQGYATNEEEYYQAILKELKSRGVTEKELLFLKPYNMVEGEDIVREALNLDEEEDISKENFDKFNKEQKRLRDKYYNSILDVIDKDSIVGNRISKIDTNDYSWDNYKDAILEKNARDKKGITMTEEIWNTLSNTEKSEIIKCL